MAISICNNETRKHLNNSNRNGKHRESAVTHIFGLKEKHFPIKTTIKVLSP